MQLVSNILQIVDAWLIKLTGKGYLPDSVIKAGGTGMISWTMIKSNK